ncbi:hypothetical protein MMC16_005713 [Acarospora aff. strigata]|nr:hypothetical protein [Acarospora aff. strigata]
MSTRGRRNGFSTLPTQPTQSQLPASKTTSPPRQHNFNIAETCYLAHTTRRKLSSEASRANHNLRVLVGHANFLDSIMIELAEASRQQERQSIPPARNVARVSQEPKPKAVTLITVTEKPADDWEVWESDESDSSESDSGDDKGEIMETATTVPVRPVLARSGTFAVPSKEIDEEDDDEDYDDLVLVRTLSRSPPQYVERPFT